MCGAVTDPKLLDGEGDHLLPPADSDDVGADCD